eukprot:365705-Chlamydomonas_euryale.AAC.9
MVSPMPHKTTVRSQRHTEFSFLGVGGGMRGSAVCERLKVLRVSPRRGWGRQHSSGTARHSPSGARTQQN